MQDSDSTSASPLPVGGGEERDSGADVAAEGTPVSEGDTPAKPKWEGLEEAVWRLGRVGAWAPGRYLNKCLTCEIMFSGDKRALSCLPCAISALLANGSPLAPTMAPTGAGSDGWLPIESAPKDGTPVDLWIDRQVGLSAGPGRLPDCWFSIGKWWVYDEYGDDQCRSEVHHATHWRPLPPPPAAGQDLSEAVLDGSTHKKITEPD